MRMGEYMPHQKAMKYGLIIILLFVSLVPPVLAQDWDEPEFFKTQLPFEEKYFPPYVVYPTMRMWRFRSEGDLGVYTTARGVGPASALLFYQAKGAKPGGEIL